MNNLSGTVLKFRAYIGISPVLREKEPKKLSIQRRETIAEWFCTKALSWGFSVDESSLIVGDISIDSFGDDGYMVTLVNAEFTGCLTVTDDEVFQSSLRNGIGYGRAFGSTRFYIVPLE